jgi:mono/diheme cytochrome c family protein
MLLSAAAQFHSLFPGVQMKKIFKWLAVLLSGLLLLVMGLVLYAWFSSQARLQRVYDLPDEPLVIPTDAASLERGRHIFQFRGCQACHSAWGYAEVPGQGADSTHMDLPSARIPEMEGHVYLEDPAIGRVIASNLTSGQGGVAYQYSDPSWVRAIRHGIRPNGTPLLFMPSTEFYFLSDSDLGSVIAYIKNAPPVDNVLPASTLSLTGRLVMTFVKGITFIPSELIPHSAPRPIAPEEGVTPEYGEYLTYSCKVCHGLGMSGGVIPGFPSSWPPALNLTFGAGSALPNWTEQGFMDTLRTGKTPDGREIRGEYMPWKSYRYMNDLELQAVWVYLKSLPAKEFGNR